MGTLAALTLAPLKDALLEAPRCAQALREAGTVKELTCKNILFEVCHLLFCIDTLRSTS